MRRALIFLPLVLNAIACAMFLVARPPAKQLIDEREQAQQVGTFTISSGDPYMLVAERPLWRWNEWHGGESVWVKALEVLNGPAVIAAKRLGDEWAGNHAFIEAATYRHESWIRAYTFAVVASLQWLLVGLLIARLTGRYKRGAHGFTRRAIE